MSCFISKASLTFTQLKKIFIKALILYYFNLERYIQIKTNASSYAIGGVLNQLTSKIKLVDQVTHELNTNLPSKIG